jgi:hypothetical protein
MVAVCSVENLIYIMQIESGGRLISVVILSLGYNTFPQLVKIFKVLTFQLLVVSNSIKWGS